MKLSEYLKKWKFSNLQINTGILSVNVQFTDSDRKAAWEMYIELLTRVATQPLLAHQGDEKAALESIFSLFGTTRKILKSAGPEALEFSKIAIIVLNQIIRPFTSKWHKIVTQSGFDKSSNQSKFRSELSDLQIKLNNYTKMLADIAKVEDISELEN